MTSCASSDSFSKESSFAVLLRLRKPKKFGLAFYAIKLHFPV